MKTSTLQQRVFLYFGLTTVVFLTIVNIVVYTVFFKSLRDNEYKYAVQSSDRAKYMIEFFLDLVDDTAISLTINQKTIINELSKNNTFRNENTEVINRMLNNLAINQQYIREIYVIGTNGSFFSSDEDSKRAKVIEMFKKDINKRKVSYVFLTGVRPTNYTTYTDEKTISFVRPIFDVTSNRYLGSLIINTDYNYLEEMFIISTVTAQQKVMVVDSKGNVIFNYPYNFDLTSTIEENPQILKRKSYSEYTEIFKKKSLLTADTIKNTEWKIIRVIFFDQLHHDTFMLSKLFIFVWIFVLASALLVSFILSKNISQPIIDLKNNILKVEEGNFNVNIKVNRKDEIGQLGHSFNNMVKRLKSLIKELVEEQKKKSDMKFQILQAQINPHFLYNTLDSIKWLAVIQNVNNIGEMTTSLINLLKYNISNNQITVTLREEINSVKNYLNIQKYRYGDIFTAKFNISEDTLECKVLKFIIQPLVENAIFHAFDSEENSGLIRLSSWKDKNNIYISVKDNGKGMPDEKIEEILNNMRKEDGLKGVGVKNIEERIKLFFGNDYGLKYDSTIGCGTEVTIKLPLDIDDKL